VQQAQTQYAAGQYSDVMNIANQGTISQAQITSQACSGRSGRAKIEVSGGLGVVVAAALSGFAYFRKTKPMLARSKN
jgi:hypothetical protein